MQNCTVPVISRAIYADMGTLIKELSRSKVLRELTRRTPCQVAASVHQSNMVAVNIGGGQEGAARRGPKVSPGLLEDLVSPGVLQLTAVFVSELDLQESLRQGV